MTTIMADRLKILAISFGLLLIVLGLMAIFLFSTQILVPAQPATEGYWEWIYNPVERVSQRLWHAGQPSQPEHFEMSFPNLPTGLSFILAGIAISAGGLFFRARKKEEVKFYQKSLNLLVGKVNRMHLKDESILAIGMISISLGILIGSFLHYEYSGFPITSLVEGILVGLSLVMNLTYLIRTRKKRTSIS